MAHIKEFLEMFPREGTRHAYRSALLHFLSFVYGVNRQGKRATAEEYERYEALSDQYVREAKGGDRDPVIDMSRYAVYLNTAVQPKSAYIRMAGVREFMALNRIWIEPDELKRIRRKLPKNKAVTKEQIITKEMIVSILQHLDIRGRALVLFLASSGCRIGEALQIELADIDLTQTPASVHIRAEIAKTREERWTFISDECKESIREWLKVREEYLRQARCKGWGIKVVNRDNDPALFGVRKTTAYYLWDLGVKKSGHFSKDEKTSFNQVRIHGLRKFFRSYMGLKIPSDIVEALIGHANGMEAVNRHYTQKQLAEEYLKGMAQVTFSGGEDLKEIRSLQEENVKLREDLEAVKRQVADRTQLMQLLDLEAVDLPPQLMDKIADRVAERMAAKMGRGK